MKEPEMLEQLNRVSEKMDKNLRKRLEGVREMVYLSN